MMIVLHSRTRLRQFDLALLQHLLRGFKLVAQAAKRLSLLI